MKKSELILIGDMAKIGAVSTKTLRYYDKIGLLTPVLIDSETGYRYYSQKQIFDLSLIKGLKLRNFSLDQIKAYLAIPDWHDLADLYSQIEKEIDFEIDHLFRARDRIQKRLFFLRKLNLLEKKGVFKDPTVKIRRIPIRKIISIREKSPFNLGNLGIRFNQIQNWAESYFLHTKTPIYILFHENLSQIDWKMADYEVGTRIYQEPVKELPFFNDIPGGTYATILYEGSQKNSGMAESKLREWIMENSFESKGPLVSLYLISPAHSKTFKNVMIEFQLRIEKKS